jgi:tripartite-type tricarboxylate transporter receptor subunit TctC
VLGALALALLFTVAVGAWAQGQGHWPSRPVRLLVGFPTGSTPDLVARSLGEALGGALGEAVVVENRAGASGNLAAGLVARATDDHTLGIVINGNLTTAKMLVPSLAWDPASDFSLLSLVATSPLALVTPVANPGGAAFFAAAAARGAQWNYGSVGAGSLAHLGMELIKSKVPALSPVHVPYPGNPAVIAALLAGQVQMALVPPGLVLPHVQSGRLRIVALAGARSPLAPDAVPLIELGVRGVNLEAWTALVGPATLSATARERLATEVPRLLHTATLRERLLRQGWSAVGSDAEGLRVRVADEAAALRAIIEAAGIRGE